MLEKGSIGAKTFAVTERRILEALAISQELGALTVKVDGEYTVQVAKGCSLKFGP